MPENKNEPVSEPHLAPSSHLGRLIRHLDDYRDARRSLRALVREFGGRREMFNAKEREDLEWKTIDTPLEIFAERLIDVLREEKRVKRELLLRTDPSSSQ